MVGQGDLSVITFVVESCFSHPYHKVKLRASFLTLPRVVACCLLFLKAAVAAATTEESETKAPVVVEKKGKARDKELVGSIPKVCLSLYWWTSIEASFCPRL